jgi:enoyl-CoA hydratase
VSDPVRLEFREHTALVTLDRPDVLNALDSTMLEAILLRIEEAGRDPRTRALVLTGAGKAFAAGADIAAMSQMGAGEAEAFSRLGHRAFAALEALPVPTLAAVNGFALGGGCELACACDWIYAALRARFGQPEVKLGLIPGFGGTSRLVRRVGLAWAKEMVLSGETIGAKRAERIGLVNRVCSEEDVVEAALAAAAKIGEKGPLAVATAKRVIQEGQGADVRVAHALEQAAFGGLFASEDAREGLEAFLAKRKARFQGK